MHRVKNWKKNGFPCKKANTFNGQSRTNGLRNKIPKSFRSNGSIFSEADHSEVNQKDREITFNKAPGGFSTWKRLDRSKVVLDLL